MNTAQKHAGPRVLETSMFPCEHDKVLREELDMSSWIWF